jgi:hypothetical protein
MASETLLLLTIGVFFAFLPVLVLITTIWALRRWSVRRREIPAWRPHPGLFVLTWILVIAAGLVLLGIGTCTGNRIIHGLDLH